MNKTLCCTISVLFSFYFSFSQNLVPNPSFEKADYTSRFLNKTGRDFERQVKHWTVPNQASTDLISPRFNSTNLTTIPPHSGKQMAGIVTNGNFWSEYVGVKLKEKLVPGTQYYVEFWISMPKYYAKKKPVATHLHPYFGILFSDKIFHRGKEILNGKPQINAGTETFVEPEKWTKVFGTFTAQEATQYLYLGQFWDDKVRPKLNIGYFFIDDVFVQAFKSTAVKYEPSRYYNISGSVASVIMDNIYFETDKYDLLPESHKELNKLIGIMQKNPSLTIEIQGHTDSQGDESHNEVLSKNRAQAVYNFLVDAGISPKRLSTRGYGDSKPIAQNKDESGRQKNRRVEFVINGNISSDELVQGPGDVYRISDFIKKDEWLPQTFTQPFAFRSICLEDNNKPGKGNADLLKKCQARSAANYILEHSKDQKVLMFNEYAPNPQGRAFTASLLEELYAQGFRFLAVEALSPKETKLNERGYPVLNSGRLIREPLFGDLLRQAIDMGFSIMAFEPSPQELAKAQKVLSKKLPPNIPKEKINKISRQWAKALNINRLFRKQPDAKVLVYCSHSSILEGEDEQSLSIAAWLKKLANINPYTVDLASLVEKCPEMTHPLFDFRNLKEPTVWLYKDKVFHTFQDGSVDAQVQFPKATVAYGRPDWLPIQGYRKPYTFNPDKHGMRYPCLVLAYRLGEDTDFAVPVDALEFPSNRAQLALMLPAGKYKLIMSDEAHFKAMEIRVE